MNNSLTPRYCSRYLTDWLGKSEHHNNVLLIEGARQVGKTSLVEQLLEGNQNATSINLEVNKTLRNRIDQTQGFEDFTALLERDTGFVPKGGNVLFIDEGQESELLGSYVRSMKETWSHVHVIISGSSMKRLFREPHTRVPVGRISRLYVTPFSFSEFLLARDQHQLLNRIDDFDPAKTSITALEHQDLLKLVEEHLTIGGLPKVNQEAIVQGDYRKVRNEIFLDQQEDFIRKELFEDPLLFKRGLQGIAGTVGFPSSLSHISQNSSEARTLVSLLVKWHLIHEVEQRSIASTTSHHPKRYLYDLGIAQDLRAMPFPSLSVLTTRNPVLRSQLGGLVENFCLLQLFDPRSGSSDISGWKKDPTGQTEVDFVLRLTEATLVPIEVKSSLKITPRSFSSIRQYLQLTGITLGIVVSGAPFQVSHETRGGEQVSLVNLPLYLVSRSTIEKVVESMPPKP